VNVLIRIILESNFCSKNTMSNFVLNNIKCVVGENEIAQSKIAVSGGKIAARGEDCPKGWKVIDGKNLLLFPGSIDPHTHFDEPGFTFREDYAHGSRGAIAGGVTTNFDMPCTSLPPVTNLESLQNKKKIIKASMYCDSGLWGGVSANAFESKDWRKNMDELYQTGVVGFKTYVLSGMDTFKHLSYSQYKKVLKHAASIGALVGVHAEDAQIVSEATEKAIADLEQFANEDPERAGAPRDTMQGATLYAASRPVEAEVEAIRRVGEIAGEFGAKIHIVHLSSGSGAEEVARLQKQGVDISAETCPQYLSFAIDDLCRLGSILKCAPPVRSNEEREKLWKHVGSTVSFLATDHAPCPISNKQTGNIFTDYGGMPGIELLLPFALTYGYHSGKMTLEQIIKMTSENAAKRFGMFPRKGSLEVAADADFSLIDLDESYEIHGKDLQSKGKFTPFDGMTFRGKIKQTWLRGECVFDEGSFSEAKGKFV